MIGVVGTTRSYLISNPSISRLLHNQMTETFLCVYCQTHLTLDDDEIYDLDKYDYFCQDCFKHSLKEDPSLTLCTRCGDYFIFDMGEQPCESEAADFICLECFKLMVKGLGDAIALRRRLSLLAFIALNLPSIEGIRKACKILQNSRYLSTTSKRNQVFIENAFTCHYCGGWGDTIDHIHPLSKGGVKIKNVILRAPV